MAHALYFACEAPIPFCSPLVLMACHVLRSQNKELPSCSTYAVPRALKRLVHNGISSLDFVYSAFPRPAHPRL
jgi:hypothetical protein